MRQDDSNSLSVLQEHRLRYYMTAPTACPYLDGKTERKAFTHLAVPGSDTLHAGLSQAGFRRSQTIAYRPACPHCNACRSVRIAVDGFEASRRWRRNLAANADIKRRPVPAVATSEQFQLFRKYLNSRHDGDGMSGMTFGEYSGMVESSPVRTLVFEYRLGSELIAACLTDVLRDGFSLVYSFFDPTYARRGLGNFIILDHVMHARELDLSHVYLGYWIEGSPKMDYKREFAPLEVLDGEAWRPLDARR